MAKSIPKKRLATKIAPKKLKKRAVPPTAVFPQELVNSDVDVNDADSVPDLVAINGSSEQSDGDDAASYGDLNPKSFVLAKSDSDGDTDNEIEIALAAGLVDAKLAAVPQTELKQVLFQMRSNAPWQATLDIVVDEKLVFDKFPDNDFEREAHFYKQAQDGAVKALTKLKALNIAVVRPDDYFAEMVKTDQHMHRIRKVLQERKKDQEGREDARRIRTERKFAVKVQRETEKQKRVDKRRLMEAVKKHKKGMKGQLEVMLKNAQGYAEDDGAEEARPGARNVSQRGKSSKKMSRTVRNRKFGSGGMKRGNKRNDKASFDMTSASKRSVGKRGAARRR